MTTDVELLRSYSQDRSESAFTELVQRHINLVYSTALREARGKAAVAEDITQAVFVELAQKASRLVRHPALAGWLYTCVRQMAANLRRSEDRRQRREQEAQTMNELLSSDPSESVWRQVQPVLDDAMHELDETDRSAVVLRFFEGRSLKEVGLAIGLNENAARMRVDRALEKLQIQLAKRGITSAASGLTAALAASAVVSAPTGLAAGVASGALTATLAAPSTTFTVLKLMTMTKLKISAASALIAAAVAVPVWQQARLNRLATEKTELLRQTDRLTELQKENERLSRVKVDSDLLQRLRLERGELYRLRGEVSLLRRRLQDLQTADPRNGQLSKQTAKDASPAGDAQDANSIRPGFYAADSWEDEGLSSPQNSTLTFFWALRKGQAKQYSESLGKTNILQLPLPWTNALGMVRGSQISETMTSADGEPMVGILHELADGTSANTWLSFRQVGDEWRISKLIGYPIDVFQVGSTNAP